MKTTYKFLPVLIGLALACGVALTLQANSSHAAPLTRIVTLIQTTIEDFNPGVFYQTGMTRLGDGEVTLLRLGIAGDWITTTNANGLVPRFEHASIAYDNRLYVFGGRTGSGSLRSIQYATVNTLTHDLSNWVTATVTLNTNLYTYTLGNAGVTGLAAVVLNGRVYLIGGEDGQQQFRYDRVTFATIDPNTGALGSLAATQALPEPLANGQAIVWNDRIYYIGGRSNPLNQGSDAVYYATPDPVTGMITAWFTATAHLPYKTYGQMSVATVGDRIYSMAGVTLTTISPPGGIVPDVYYAQPLTATGDITGWSVTNALPRNIFAGAAVSFGGQIYAIGGALDGISNASNFVFAALEQPGGGVAAWPATSAIAPPRLLHSAVVNSDGWIYVIGGSTGSNQPIQQHIINAGATTGQIGSAYVDHGTFTSEPFDLNKNYPVTQLSWVMQLTNPAAVTATLRYRYRLNGGTYSNWSPLFPANYAAGVSTTTLPLNVTARYFQYQVFFTTTNPLLSPVLNQVEIRYETPDPPQFQKLANPISGSSVSAGDRITYTLTFSNVADLAFANTFITDTIPVSTTYVPGSISASPGITVHQETAPTLYWEIGTLPPHTGGVLSYVVTVNTNVQIGDVIRNIADFDSDVIAVRSSSVFHTVGAPYKLSKSHVTSAPGQTAGRVQPGDLITYTLIYTNPAGSVPLSGVIISDVLSSSVIYVGSIGSPAPDSQLARQGIMRWSIGGVPTGTIHTLGYVVQVLTDTTKVPDGSVIVNTAQISANGQQPVPSNSDQVPVRYRFDLKLSMSDGRTKAVPGDLVTYTTRITNVTSLPITATNIVVYDYLEPGLPGLTRTNVLSCVGGCPGWTFAGNDPYGDTVFTHVVPALGPNLSTVITLVAQVSPTLHTTAPEVLAAANYVQANADAVHGVEIDPSNQSQEDIDVVAGPDIAVTDLHAATRQALPNVPTSFYVTVKNAGFAPTIGPDGTGWFGVDLYVKPAGSPPPAGPDDRYLGACPTATDYCPTTFRSDHYRIAKFFTTTIGAGGLGINESWPLTYTLAITPAGTYWVYAQADTYGTPLTTTNGTAQHGRVVEGNEVNNIFGPFIIKVDYYRVYLPIIAKKFP